MSDLTHIDETGRAAMVDVGDKDVTTRRAVAVGAVKMHPETLSKVKVGNNKKGPVQNTAELAGIMAAKKTSDLIPLCHPLALSKVSVRVEINEGLPGLDVRAEVKTAGKTGVEMEALTAVSVACLTIYDMLKAAEKGMEIVNVRLAAKSGGRSGDWSADA